MFLSFFNICSLSISFCGTQTGQIDLPPPLTITMTKVGVLISYYPLWCRKKGQTNPHTGRRFTVTKSKPGNVRSVY